MTHSISPKTDITIGILTILALSSGACALAYEILFSRALSTVMGDMFYVNATLLATFLVGLGLGAKCARRWTGSLPFFEILTGLYALVLPSMMKWLSTQPIMLGISASPALTVFATIAFIALPAILIGFSLPLFSAFIKYRQIDSLSFRGVYIAYNLGAVFSVLAVELVLVRLFGIRLSLALVGCLNIVNGLVIIITRATPPEAPCAAPKAIPRRTVLALALASFCSAIFQMFFLKLTYHFFYPQAENFAIGLSIILSGIFLGSWLASKVRIPFETYLIAGAFLLGLIYVDYYPLLKLFKAFLPWSKNSAFCNLSFKLAFGCLFALGPMIVFGALIPALMDTEKDVAGESGYLLFVSSVANAAGYLAYVFIVHPLLPAGAMLACLSAILLISSLVVAKFKWSRFQLIVASISICLAIILPFIWRESYFYLARKILEFDRRDYVKIFKSGPDSATLVRTYWDFEWICYNGHPSIYVMKNGRINPAEMVSGIIPALYAPRFKKALVIGLGTGITSGSLSLIFESTDVVDLNRAFFKLLPRVSYANFDVKGNQSVTLHCADGRSFLIGKEGLYDVILNTAEAPDYYSAQKLYTLEFYERVVKALKPDGVFCTWLSSDEMSEPGVLLILSALHRHFRYCDLRVLENSYCQLTCSNLPLHTRKFSELSIRGELVKQLQQSIPDFDLDEYFQDIRISENLFEHFTPEVKRENTDDYPALEFSAVRGTQLGAMGDNLFCQPEKQRLMNIDIVRKDQARDAPRLARRARVFDKIGKRYYSNSFRPVMLSDRNLAAHFLLWRVDRLLAQDARSPAAGRILDEVLRINPDAAEAYNYLGKLKQSMGNLDEAIKDYRKALQLNPDFVEARDNLKSAMQQKEKGQPLQHIDSMHFSCPISRG
jgi:spermidine synthase